MTLRTIGLVLAAVLFAGGSVYAAIDWLDSRRRSREPAPRVDPPGHVLVAEEELPAGTLPRPEQLR